MLAARDRGPPLGALGSGVAGTDLLRGGTNVGAYGCSQVRALAASAVGEDHWGYRAEFLGLVDRARQVTGERPLVVSE